MPSRRPNSGALATRCGLDELHWPIRKEQTRDHGWFFNGLLDAATLDFLEDLMVQRDLAHLLVVGAYRDNEVDSTHLLEYGWPRVWKELLANGIRVGKDRVRKLMQLRGVKARGKRKFKATTDSNHRLPVAENPRTCSIESSRSRSPTVRGPATSPTSPPTKAGCTWRW
jgi:HTH-like domain